MASLRPPPREYFTGTLPNPASKRTLDVSNVSVRFHEKVVLKNVSFFVPVGEFLCLCGPNGAGKSTLLKSILGLHRPSSGAITIAGLPLREGRRIGYVPQRKSFDRDFPATALEVVVANLRGGWPFRIREDERELAKKALVRTGAEKLIDSQMRDLSGGETQRVFLARALITQPELIILDEPTAGVDVGGRAAIVDLLSDIHRSDTIAAILVTPQTSRRSRAVQNVSSTWIAQCALGAFGTNSRRTKPLRPFTLAITRRGITADMRSMATESGRRGQRKRTTKPHTAYILAYEYSPSRAGACGGRRRRRNGSLRRLSPCEMGCGGLLCFLNAIGSLQVRPGMRQD